MQTDSQRLIYTDIYIGAFYIHSGYCFESLFENDFVDEISFTYPKDCWKSLMYFSTKIKMTDIVETLHLIDPTKSCAEKLREECLTLTLGSKTATILQRPYVPAGNYMFKVNNWNIRTRCEICSKLTIKIPERRHGVVLVSLLLTFNIFHALL